MARYALMALAAWSVTATAVMADTTIGSTSTAGGFASSGHDYFGQTFTVPAGETGIPSVSIVARQNNAASLPASLRLYAYDEAAGAFVGAPLFSQAVSVPTGESVVSGTPNLAVAAGGTLALVLDWGTSGGIAGDAGTQYQLTNYYPGGHLIFAGAAGAPVAFPSYDAAFQVRFGAIPEPTTAVLTASVAAAATLARRRRC